MRALDRLLAARKDGKGSTTLYAVNEQQEDAESSGPFLLFTDRKKAERAVKRWKRAYPHHDYRVVNLTLDEDMTP